MRYWTLRDWLQALARQILCRIGWHDWLHEISGKRMRLCARHRGITRW